MSILLSIRNTIQDNLFPFFEEIPEPLSEKEQQFIQVVTLMNPQKHMSNYKWKGNGRKPEDRLPNFRISDEILTYNRPLSDIIITIL